MKGLRFEGGQIDVLDDGRSVAIHAPTADLSAQAIVSSPGVSSGLLVSKDRDPEYAAGMPLCTMKAGKRHQGDQDVVLMVSFPDADGYPIQVCRGCVMRRSPGRPLRIDMEMIQ